MTSHPALRRSDERDVSAEDAVVLDAALRDGWVAVQSRRGQPNEAQFAAARLRSLCERGLMCRLSAREDAATYVATQWGEIAFAAVRRREALASWRPARFDRARRTAPTRAVPQPAAKPAFPKPHSGKAG
jgi:hypothetical protein